MPDRKDKEPPSILELLHIGLKIMEGIVIICRLTPIVYRFINHLAGNDPDFSLFQAIHDLPDPGRYCHRCFPEHEKKEEKIEEFNLDGLFYVGGKLDTPEGEHTSDDLDEDPIIEDLIGGSLDFDCLNYMEQVDAEPSAGNSDNAIQTHAEQAMQGHLVLIDNLDKSQTKAEDGMREGASSPRQARQVTDERRACYSRSGRLAFDRLSWEQKRGKKTRRHRAAGLQSYLKLNTARNRPGKKIGRHWPSG